MTQEHDTSEYLDRSNRGVARSFMRSTYPTTTVVRRLSALCRNATSAEVNNELCAAFAMRCGQSMLSQACATRQHHPRIAVEAPHSLVGLLSRSTFERSHRMQNKNWRSCPDALRRSILPKHLASRCAAEFG